SQVRVALPRRYPHVSRVDGELEAGQEAHAEQAIDALSKGAFGIVLNDDWDVLGLQRAQLNHRSAAPFGRAGAVGCIQSDGAVEVDLHLALLRERGLQGTQGC